MKKVKTRRNLDHSVKEGTAHSVMMGSGEKYLSAYAISLGASDKQVGFLTSIPQLLASFSQLFSTNITEKISSRKKVVLTSSLIQSLIWIPIGYLIFVNSFPVWKLIAFAIFYWISNYIAIPAWSSWIGDVVPDKIKGRFFGKRRMSMGLSLFLSTLISGILLYISSEYNPFLGFGIIFFIAFISKLISCNYLRKIDEPSFHVYEESEFSFFDFMKRITKTNFGKFVIYLTLMTLSVNIAGPYFAVYMLKDIQMDYLTYTLIISASSISSFIFIGIWGKYSDFFGNKKIMELTGYMIPLLPFFWTVSTNTLYLICVQIFSGFAWSGFNISTFNFIFDTVSPSKRVRCVSYYNLLNGIAIFLGTTLGGILINYGTMFWSNFILLLLISGSGRFLSSFIMLPKIKEVKWISGRDEQRLLTSVASDVFEGLRYPVLFLSERRLVIKRKTEGIIDWIVKFIERVLGKRSKYG